MKKSLQLLVTAAMFAAGAMTASADRYYETTSSIDPYEGVQEGVQYALQGGQAEFAGTSAFLNGTSFTFSGHLNATNLYTFVKTGGETADGYTVYYIKNSAGEYLYAPGQTNLYGTSENRAWKVALKPASVYESDYEYSNDDDDYTGIDAYAQEAKDLGDEFDYSTATYLDVSNGTIIVDAEGDITAACTYLLSLASGASTGDLAKGTNYNRNVWVIYETQQQDALSYLDTVLNELFPNGFDPDNYEVGIDPGQYSEDALNALIEAYDATQGDVNENNAEALADALKAAWEAFKASFVNFGEGYYIITTFRSPTGVLFDNTDNVSGMTSNYYTITSPAVAITHTQNGTEYSCGDWDVYDPDNDDAWIGHAAAPYFIWKVIKTDVPGMYFVQNWKTGRYIGTPGASKASNTPIPMVEEPNAKFNMAPSESTPGYWKFYSDELTKQGAWGGGWEMGGLHAPGDVLNMVTWNSETEGSLWYPRSVTDEMLETIKALGEQPALNQELKNLVNTVESTIEDNINWGLALDGQTISANADVQAWLNFSEVDGLVTDGEAQITSNAADSSEGTDFSIFTDGDLTNLWHSSWHESDSPVDEEGNYLPHDLEIDLQKSVEAVTIKMVSRNGHDVNGLPWDVAVYGSNDGENWTLVSDSVRVHWYSAADAVGTVAGSTNYAGWFTSPLGYSHVRFDVFNTYSDKGSYGKYFNLSELRAYEGAEPWAIVEDPNSPYYIADESLRNAVDELVDQAKSELEDNLATRETIDALTAAFDALKAAMPNVAQLTDLIASAQTTHDGAEVGTDPGYFDQAAIDALQAAIDAASAAKKDNMTVDEVKAAVAALNAALDAFADALIRPVDGIYMIKSTSGTASNELTAMFAQNSSKLGSVQKGGRTYNKESQVYDNDPTFADRLGAYWQVEKSGEGYTMKNLYTGLYLSPVSNESEAVAQSETPYVFGLQFANRAGSFNILIDKADAYNGTYLYVNAQPGGGVVTWSSAGEFVTDDDGNVIGTDNSGWAFVPQESIAAVYDNIYNSGMVYDLEVKNAPQIVTFPVDVDVEFTEDAKFYTVIGQDAAKNIQLEEAKEVKAGSAYVLVPASAEATDIRVYFSADKYDALNPTCTAAEAVNGLVPVFEYTEVPAGCGVFNPAHTLVLVAEEGDEVDANTGYFAVLPETTQTGAAQIAAEARINPEGINTVTFVNNKADNKIYTLSGVRVNSVKNLPAGLYIINGKKYIVK